MNCLFATDLHGRPARYDSLFATLRDEPPEALFLGGDLLPSALAPRAPATPAGGDFLQEVVVASLQRLRDELGADYPEIFVILGNDDGRLPEPAFLEAETRGLWRYAHGRRSSLGTHPVFGYCFVPPTPFRLKDWERYDVSRYVDPGCVSPEEGARTVPVPPHRQRYATIRDDLERLAGDDPLDDSVWLFHTPPYDTRLDRAALDGRTVDHVPVDVHVGSIAVRRFIEERQPLVTLHGHIHESARITGAWRQRLGRTWMLSAAHDGPELALVRFDLGDLDGATRELL